MLKRISIIALLMATVSCGPSTQTSVDYVSANLTSDPAGATVVLDGKTVGVTPCLVQLPVTVTRTGKGRNVTANYAPWTLQFVKDGYTEQAVFHPQTTPNYNGAYDIRYTFRNKSYINDPTIMAGEADKMVSRDNPGATALEGTIIRWYFDSEPRGARIYWRVISSIPQIVKNTNEAYLTTTPYEETRAFNILGLTYENSRDVTIEIKASRKGYADQVKRYNVRQAIDQQEISGFFELVKLDEE